MNARHHIEAQAAARWREFERQAALDVAAWSFIGGTAVAYGRQVVALGLLGSVAAETGPVERVKAGREAQSGTDCEDRCLRLAAAIRRRFPTAKVSLDWVGQPPWHVRLLVNGQVVETIPAWALGGPV